MKATKIAVAAVLALELGACTTMRTTRDRVVKTTPVCADQQVQIYFEPDSAEVTREGQAVLNQAAAQARACKVTGVDVLGLADAAGAPQANLELSARRAQAVAAALAAAGLPKAGESMSAAGQAGSMTADGATRPLRRRADIVIHLSR